MLHGGVSKREQVKMQRFREAVAACVRCIAPAGVLPGWIWRHLPARRTFRMALSGEASFRYAAAPDDAIGRALYWDGLDACEPETAHVFMQLAKKAVHVLDIGANTGIYTLLACAVNPSVRVVAFEPVPSTYARLCDNIRLNGWEMRCETRNEAVSSHVGSTLLHVPHSETPTSASLHPGGFRGMPGKLIEVPLTTVAAACHDGGQVDLVKIDVEGFEDQVLEGMLPLLARAKPAIIIECTPDGPYEAIQNILGRFGYQYFHLHKRGPVLTQEIIPCVAERYRNYLCLPAGAQLDVESGEHLSRLWR